MHNMCIFECMCVCNHIRIYVCIYHVHTFMHICTNACCVYNVHVSVLACIMCACLCMHADRLYVALYTCARIASTRAYVLIGILNWAYIPRGGSRIS